MQENEIKKEISKSSPSKSGQPKEISEKINRSRSRSKSREKDEKKEKSKEKISTEKKIISSFPSDEKQLIKIVCWNIAGIRPFFQKKDFDILIKEENPDIICFNETKVDEELIEKMNYKKMFKEKYNFHTYWNCCTEKKGYSGTAILTKYEPISIKYGMGISKHDKEGRIITIEYEKFFLVCCYTPNSGEGLKRLGYRIDEWDKDFFDFINNLKNEKDVILTGDLNVARENIDILTQKEGKN